APRDAARQAAAFDVLSHAARLLLVVGAGVQKDADARPVLGPELFAPAPRVILNDSVGGREDGVGGTVILLQLDHFDGREMLLQFQQVGRLRAAPAVNA